MLINQPQVVLWGQHGDQPSKNSENLDFSSVSALILAFSLLWFLCSLVSTILYEADKINRLHVKRDPLASAQSKC